MGKRLFVLSGACRSGAFCGMCLHPIEGGKWRAAWSRTMELPESAEPAECMRSGGPGAADPTTAEASSRPGPGDVVKWVLTRMGYEQLPGNRVRCPNGKSVSNCSCESMRRQMNTWGMRGCLKKANRQVIADWFAKRAEKCGMEVTRATIAGLLTAGIKEWIKQRRSPVKAAAGQD